MTGRELIECLRRTGTGADKLEAAEAHLDEHDGCGGTDLVDAMEESGDWTEGTVGKARRMLGGTPPEAFGAPPSDNAAIGKAAGEAMAAKLAPVLEKQANKSTLTALVVALMLGSGIAGYLIGTPGEQLDRAAPPARTASVTPAPATAAPPPPQPERPGGRRSVTQTPPREEKS